MGNFTGILTLTCVLSIFANGLAMADAKLTQDKKGQNFRIKVSENSPELIICSDLSSADIGTRNSRGQFEIDSLNRYWHKAMTCTLFASSIQGQAYSNLGFQYDDRFHVGISINRANWEILFSKILKNGSSMFYAKEITFSYDDSPRTRNQKYSVPRLTFAKVCSSKGTDCVDVALSAR